MEKDRIQFVGHSCLWITLDGEHFLVDTNFSTRLVGFLKRHQNVGIDVNKLPDVSALLVTHAHYDHLDLFSYKFFPQNKTMIAPKGLSHLINRFLHNPVVELKTGESHTVGAVTITAVKTQHKGFRVSGLSYTHCNGYILKGSKHCVYLPGDTGYGPHFAEIGAQFNVDVACLPIGAYKPRWLFSYQHMDPWDAVKAFEDLRAKTFIPIHWGAFRLTFESVDEPLKEFQKILLNSPQLKPHTQVLQPGEALEL